MRLDFKKARKVLYIFQLSVAAIVGVLLIVSNLYFPGQFSEKRKSFLHINIQTIEPKNEFELKDRMKVYRFRVEDILKSGDSIAFFSDKNEVIAYLDGKKIFHRKATETKYGNTTGSAWNQIEVSSYASVLTIKEIAEPRINAEQKTSFYIGNKSVLVEHFLIKYSLEFVLTLIISLMGIYSVVKYALVEYELGQREYHFYYGIVMTLAGMWAINQSHIATMFFGNRVAAYFIGYTLIMLIPYPLLLFINSYYEIEENIFTSVMGILYVVNIIGSLLFQATNVFQLHQLVVFTHSLFVAILIYMCSVMKITIKRNIRHNRFNYSDFVEFATIMVSVIIIIAIYYLQITDTFVYTMSTLLVYSGVMWYKLSQKKIKKIEENQRLKYYYNLAEIDVLTGLRNRNAYENWMKERQRKENVTVVVYDLNDLKKTNDTLGHKEGDMHIVEAGRIISVIFDKKGTNYRIGGDEFCTIITEKLTMPMSKTIMVFRALEESYNQKGPKMELHIAIGYATYDPKIDETLEDTRDRADEMMYKNKNALKSEKQ
ncbi:diguanylate cyclase (GGDEF) domain-containing protein [Lachnospiraceae bacterium C7]|nr:diguanylate cyclase (GGDEF) domain-containing protein [Lachnospiraceae bacterium C7]